MGEDTMSAKPSQRITRAAAIERYVQLRMADIEAAARRKFQAKAAALSDEELGDVLTKLFDLTFENGESYTRYFVTDHETDQ